jgi:hypothetical protein
MAAQPHSAPQIEKLLYSRKEVAYALSISTRGVDRLIASQTLPTRRLGGRVVIPASAVRSFADRVVRQDMLLKDGEPVTKHQLTVIARNSKSRTARSATQFQETPEEGARRLRASGR